MNTNPILEQIRLETAVMWCREKGFTHLIGWRFEKGGRVYDLSAADLSKLDHIEQNGLFVADAS